MDISPMLSQIANENNLRNAWIKINYHARTSLEYFDKYAYEEFEENLDLNLAIIQHLLMTQKYHFGDLRIFEIPKGDDKRKIYFLNPKDGVVAQAIINIIAPLFETQFSTHSFGNRISYASTESKNPFLDWHDQYSKYINHILSILELSPSNWYEITDIANFYPSINITVLLSKIIKKVVDASALSLLDNLLTLKAINSKGGTEDITGLPPGPIYSHLFANLYLDDFDKFMEQNTESYSRYVDDLCFVTKNEKDLDDINKKIAEEFSALGDLFLKERKTESYPISDPQPLIEHTRKLKYDVRFGVIETLKSSSEINEVQMTEKVFHDLFLKVEKEEEISKIVEDAAGFIAAGFGKLSIESQLAINIAYGILLKRPQRVNAIRALLGYLMGVFLKNPDAKFIELIKDGPDILKITFLQLLMGYSKINQEISDLLMALKDQEENYLVRANVYVALENFRYRFEVEELRQLITVETSDYVLARLLQSVNYSAQNENIWIELRQVINDKSNDLVLSAIISVLYKISYENDGRAGIKILLPTLIDHTEGNLFNLAILLKLVSQFSDHDSLRQVYEELQKTDREICNNLLKITWTYVLGYFIKRKNDYTKLMGYIDSLKQLNIQADYFAGYQEMFMNSHEDSILEQEKSKEPIASTSLPEWYTKKFWEIDKGLYCESSFQTNYSCRFFQDGEKRGVLETIPADTIFASKEFNTVQEWIKYIKELDEKKVIKLLDVGVFKDGTSEKVFTAYEIEPGFDSIREWLNSGKLVFNEKAILEIMLKTTQKLEQTTLSNGFYFQNITPCNVLWNPQGEIRLLSIGSALLLPRYVCGSKSCNKKYHNDEIGKTTGGYFLGLLAIQMITKDECPVLVLESKKSSKIKNGFYENNEISPHIKSVIARMVQHPIHRYGNLDSIKQDLSRVFDFLEKLNTVSKEKTSLTGKLTLIDYMDFRLEVTNRNPDGPIDPLQKANWLLEKLSDQISYYSDKETLKNLFSRNSKMPIQNPLIWYWLSPESRTLIKLAFDWDNLIDILNEQLDTKYQNNFSIMLLGRVVYFEALATIQSLLTFGSLNKDDSKLFSNNLITITRNEDFGNLRIRASQDNYSRPLPNPYANEDLNPIINLFKFVEENTWIYFLRRLTSKLIFSGINFARHNVDFYFVDETLAFKSQPLLKSKKFNSNTWLVHKLPFIFLNKLSLNSNISTGSLWEDVIQIIKYLYYMNPSKRIRGKLLDYQAIASPSEGNISFGWNWIYWNPNNANFTEDTVLTLGNFLVERRNPRAIQIDLTQKANRLSSIFSYSKLFENITFYSKKSPLSILSLSMKKYKWLAWVTILILALFQYLKASTIWQTLPIASQIMLNLFLIIAGRLLIEPVWKLVEAQLGLIHPEERVLETK